MKSISIVILCLFIYTKCDLNCINISPYYSSDCVLSDQDLRNSSNFRYCCYLKFEKYNSYYGTYSTTKKCFPYNQTEYNKVKRAFDNGGYYDYNHYLLYGELDSLFCNNRTLEDDYSKETGCNGIKPSSASDCVLSTNEYNQNNLCCYIKDTSHNSPYCKKYTKSEAKSKASDINSITSSISTFVCISSSASFLKISFFIIAILLL